MGRNRFETPDLVRLALSDGDWIEVRRKLSAGEFRRMHATPFTKLADGGGLSVNLAVLGLARTKAYLVDWSFRDANDKPVRCTSEAIEALTQSDLDEIEKALDAHLEAVDGDSPKKIETAEITSSPV